MPDGSVFDPVAWWSQVAGTRRAVLDVAHNRTISYAELHRDANQWSALLTAHGVRPGDRVAILAQNRYEFLPLLFGCLRVGAVLVPLNWRLAPSELQQVMRHAQPRLLVSDARGEATPFTGMDLTGTAETQRLDLDADVPSWFATQASARGATRVDDPTLTDVTGSSPAMLLYTSGTTGAPKGVMVSHRQLLWNAVSTSLGWSLHEDDVAAVATPFFHTAAWHVYVTPLLHVGGCIALLPTFDASNFLSTLAQHAVTRTFCVPTQLYLLQQAAEWGRPVPSLRQFISGGAPLPPHLLRAAHTAGYPVRDAYGLTECGPNCFVMPDEALARDPYRVGWPLPFVRMRVVGEDGHTRVRGMMGELQLQAPQLFSGYFRDDDLTAAAFTPDGWLRTGDLAAVDADGAYRIGGRIKDLFISGGENVYPGEVEAALAQCGGVRDVAVVGVPHEVWGEVGCAVIVPANPRVEADDILRQLRERIAGFKVPQRVRFVDSLPTLGSGKVDRDAVRSLALEPRRGED